jgi:hypothetical protein
MRREGREQGPEGARKAGRNGWREGEGRKDLAISHSVPHELSS